MMPEENKKQWFNVGVAIIGVVCAALLLEFFYDCYYDINDDVLIKDILSGAYSGEPSGYNIQMLYPLGVCLSGLYHIAPDLPWYGIFLCGCHIFCGYLVAVRLCRFTGKVWKKILWVVFEVFMIFALLLWQLVYVQYTVTSGLLMATALFWFYTTDSRVELKGFLVRNVVSIILMVIAFGLRSEMALLLLPIFAVVGIIKWSDDAIDDMRGQKQLNGKRSGFIAHFFSQKNVFKYVTLICVTGVLYLAMFFANKMAYSDENWQEFIDLFDSRTELYDFLGLPQDYDANIERYETAGVSREQHTLLLNYNFIIDNDIDADLFERLEVLIGDGGNRYFAKGFSDTIREYIYRITHKTDGAYGYLVWIGYVALIVTAFMNRNRSYLWKVPVLFAARSVLWLFLISRGRMPERITVPLLVMEFAALAALLIMENGRLKQKEQWLYRRFWPVTICTFMLTVGIHAMFDSVESVNAEEERRESRNKEWIAMQEYAKKHEGNLYLLDIYSTVAYSEKMFENVDNGLSNYTYAGGWACKSPMEKEKLLNFDVYNVEADLLARDDIYFIAYADKDLSWLSDFYAANGIKAEVVLEETIPFEKQGAFGVFSVRKRE